MTNERHTEPVYTQSARHIQDAMSKAAIRTKSLQLREALTDQEKVRYSQEIISLLTAHTCYQEAKTVLAYVNYRSEVETLSLIKQALCEGKSVFVPRVEGKDMEFYQITDLAQLRAGYRGILEPASDISFSKWLVQKYKGQQMSSITAQKMLCILVCMPGTAFDKSRHRIGYGGGFYDRYLEKLFACTGQVRLSITTAALAYSCQVWDEIPAESHDITPDFIFTQQGCIGERNRPVI